MQLSEVLIESKSLRESHIDRVEVLEKVKAISFLPDDIHVTTDMLANYYEVSRKTIESLIQDNKDEIVSDGYRVLTGEALKGFKAGLLNKGDLLKEGDLYNQYKFVSSLAIFPRRSILRIGMLLRDSQVAKQIRDYILNVEDITRKEAPHIIEKAIKKPTWNQIQSNVRAKSKMFKLLGLTEGSALAHALNHEEMETGVDLTPFKRLVREEDTDQAVTPTELGKLFNPPMNAQKMNLLLEKCRLQLKNPKNEWELTEKGKPYAKLITAIINKKENGKTVSSEKQAIRWKRSVLGLVKPTGEVAENNG